jgi:hypothetical protein
MLLELVGRKCGIWKCNVFTPSVAHHNFLVRCEDCHDNRTGCIAITVPSHKGFSFADNNQMTDSMIVVPNDLT